MERVCRFLSLFFYCSPLLSQPLASLRKSRLIPERLFFYGIVYAGFDFILYEFFPRYVVTPSEDIKWGFCCYESLVFEAWYTRGYPYSQVEVMNTLLRVQRHTQELAEMIFPEMSELLGDDSI